MTERREQRGQREVMAGRGAESYMQWFSPHVTAVAMTEPNQRQELGNSSRSPTRVART